jgi:hypothetical protein
VAASYGSDSAATVNAAVSRETGVEVVAEVEVEVVDTVVEEEEEEEVDDTAKDESAMQMEGRGCCAMDGVPMRGGSGP